MKWACFAILALQVAAKGLASVETNRLIVVWRDTTSPTMQSARVAALQARSSVPLAAVQAAATYSVVHLGESKAGAELTDVIERLRRDPSVAAVEVDLRMYPATVPNDPEYSAQWHFHTPEAPWYGMNLPAAWALTTGDNVIVAVVDTGVRPHADLVSKLLPGYDMIADPTMANDQDGRDADATDPGDWTSSSASTWHGTHTAGTIGASTNNSAGVAGVSWGAHILPIRFLGVGGGYLSDMADGIRWAAGLPVAGTPLNPNKAKVISVSAGGGGPCFGTLQNAINAAMEAGSIVIVSAGNSNTNVSTFAPANCNNVICVGAHGPGGERAPYSNYGPLVDVLAPGGNSAAGETAGILSTSNTGLTSPGADSYRWKDGTSMATPHVAGLVALMASADPTITTARAKTILKLTARDFPAGDCTHTTCGAGLVDAYAAVSYTMTGTVTSSPQHAADGSNTALYALLALIPIGILLIGSLLWWWRRRRLHGDENIEDPVAIPMENLARQEVMPSPNPSALSSPRAGVPSSQRSFHPVIITEVL